MEPDPAFVGEAIFARPWPHRERAKERVALAIAEAQGRVRPAFASWVRDGRPAPVPPRVAQSDTATPPQPAPTPAVASACAKRRAKREAEASSQGDLFATREAKRGGP